MTKAKKKPTRTSQAGPKSQFTLLPRPDQICAALNKTDSASDAIDGIFALTKALPCHFTAYNEPVRALAPEDGAELEYMPLTVFLEIGSSFDETGETATRDPALRLYLSGHLKTLLGAERWKVIEEKACWQDTLAHARGVLLYFHRNDSTFSTELFGHCCSALSVALANGDFQTLTVFSGCKTVYETGIVFHEMRRLGANDEAIRKLIWQALKGFSPKTGLWLLTVLGKTYRELSNLPSASEISLATVLCEKFLAKFREDKQAPNLRDDNKDLGQIGDFCDLFFRCRNDAVEACTMNYLKTEIAHVLEGWLGGLLRNGDVITAIRIIKRLWKYMFPVYRDLANSIEQFYGVLVTQNARILYQEQKYGILCSLVGILGTDKANKLLKEAGLPSVDYSRLLLQAIAAQQETQTDLFSALVDP